MKRLILPLIALALALPCSAQTRPDGSAKKPTEGTQIGAWDGTNFRFITATSDGALTSVVTPSKGAPTDKSGTITTGGTSQTLAAAKSDRVYIEIQNISDETMYVNFGAAATTDSNSFKIVAGGSYVNPTGFCPNGTITIIGATTGKKFVAKEY